MHTLHIVLQLLIKLWPESRKSWSWLVISLYGFQIPFQQKHNSKTKTTLFINRKDNSRGVIGNCGQEACDDTLSVYPDFHSYPTADSNRQIWLKTFSILIYNLNNKLYFLSAEELKLTIYMLQGIHEVSFNANEEFLFRISKFLSPSKKKRPIKWRKLV